MTDYNKEKLFDIMNTTQNNYANMLKRLDRKSRFSNFVVIYYSIALIIYSLTAKFFPERYDEDLSAYFSIIISVVILAYSIINSNAKYNERIKAAENVLNSVKTMKRELTEDNIDEKRAKYHEITNAAEYRSDVDFFKTLKQKCRENDIRWWRYKDDIKAKTIKANANIEELNKLNNYMSEVSPFFQQIKIVFDYALSGIVTIMPVLIFLLCFFI